MYLFIRLISWVTHGILGLVVSHLTYLLHLKAPQTKRCGKAPEPYTCLPTPSFKRSLTNGVDALVAEPQDNMFSKKIFWLASALLLIGVQAQSHQMDGHGQVAALKTELSHKYPAVNALLWTLFHRLQNVAKRRRSEESPTRCSPKPSTALCPTNALPAVFTPRLACCRAPSFALQEVLPILYTYVMCAVRHMFGHMYGRLFVSPDAFFVFLNDFCSPFDLFYP